MKRKIQKSLLSIFICLSLLLSHSYNCLASADYITEGQLREGIAVAKSILTNFKSLGLTPNEVIDLFTFSSTGSVEREVPQIMPSAFYDYDGNPPADDTDQENRVSYIFDVAKQNFQTRYYQGARVDYKDFGIYLMYLYISHYIDGPGRAPTSHERPYIITTSDINAYKKFINEQQMTAYVNAFISLGMFVYSARDFKANLDEAKTLALTTKESARLIKDQLSLMTDGDSVIADVSKHTLNYILQNYSNESDITVLSDTTVTYVTAATKELHNFKDEEEELVKSWAITVTSLILDVCLGGFGLVSTLLAIVPNFVYTFNYYIKRVSLLALGTTLNGRIVDRTIVEIE